MKTRILGVLVISLIAFSEPAPAVSCGESVVCNDGTSVSCSCPRGGVCTANYNGVDASVSCQCSGSSTVNYTYCGATICTQESCNNYCGGPNSGACMGGTCHCL